MPHARIASETGQVGIANRLIIKDRETLLNHLCLELGLCLDYDV